MDLSHPVVVIEPNVLGNLVIEDYQVNTNNTESFETFRQNQIVPTRRRVCVQEEESLALIRANGSSVNTRNLVLPTFISPLLISNRVIPLPEFPPERQTGSNTSSVFVQEAIVFKKEDDMVSLSKLWSCDCPIPGNKPLVVCDDCRRREHFEWTWDKTSSDPSAIFQNENRDVLFNPGFSVGTGAVRGSVPLKQGYHHYWEIEMSTQVYGTDMMIGVGTEKTDLVKHSNSFVSLIGLDEDSWGLSYMGVKQHKGHTHPYTNTFGQHTVVGVHLDLWSGRMEFYINRKPVGLAFNGLQGKVLYPMISSTAARSGMNLVFCRSYAPSLQLQTMLSLRKSMMLPDNVTLFKVLPDDVIPPGLKMWIKNNFWWITSGRKPIDRNQVQFTEEERENSTNKKKEYIKKPQIIITPTIETSSSSHTVRRKKTKKDDSADPGRFDQLGATLGVLTRSMAATARRSCVPGTSPIFASDPSTPQPSTSRRLLLEIRRPMIRSNSFPSFDETEDDEEDLPPRAASSASNSSEPGSKRMCLRSSKK